MQKKEELQTQNLVESKAGAASFERRRFSIGIFSTATVIVVIALFVIVNLFVSGLEISWDFTSDQRFSISRETRDFLREIDEPITIYTLFRQGQDDNQGLRLDIEEMLSQYSSASRHIRVVNRDPYIYWAFVNNFDDTGEGIAPGSIIVESNQRHRVIHRHEFVRESIDFDHLQQTGEMRGIASIEIEPQITNALVFVTQEAELIAYELVGRGQTPLSPSMALFLRDAGYELRQHNTAHGSIPSTSNVLIVTPPIHDFTEAEAEHLREYLATGGAALFLIGQTSTALPNFLGVIESFGVTVNTEYRLHDLNLNYHLHPQTFTLLPHMVGHTITARMHDTTSNRLFLPNSAAVVTQTLPPNITLQNLIRTSSQAVLEAPNGSVSASRQFDVALGILHEFVVPSPEGSVIIHGMTRTSRIAVIGNDFMVHDSLSTTLNRRYIVETMNWLIDRPERDIFITPRLFQPAAPVIVSARDSTIMKVFVWGVFPAVILGTGVAVWLKRRNR